jgi:SAM-dependent methyltransferase
MGVNAIVMLLRTFVYLEESSCANIGTAPGYFGLRSTTACDPTLIGAPDLNIPYLIPRVIRHFLPEKLVRALLLRSIIIKPGLETSDPDAAVRRYKEILAGIIQNKRVLIFGYGGRFDLGFGLLKEGAAHVVLCDKYAPPDEAHNLRMFGAEEKYFFVKDNKLRPHADQMTLLEADIREIQPYRDLEPVDIVLSNSVYEHVDDVEGITRALAALTKPTGIHIHFVDLRDHFFKYPFEMLRFSESTWRKWLNPSTNHNRYRLWNYRSVFEACFEQVEIKILASEADAFRELLPYIRPEFISADQAENFASLILVTASKPRKFQ